MSFVVLYDTPRKRSPIALWDIFTDPNGTSLDTHTISPVNPGTAWVESGDFDIQGNRANTTGATPADPGFLAYADCGVANYTLDGVLRIGGAGVIACAFVVRLGVDGKFYHVKITQLANAFQIVEWDGAAFTTRANAAVAIVAATDYTIAVTVSGTDITATINGANQITYNGATVNQTATRVGLQASFNGCLFDDLKVTRL